MYFVFLFTLIVFLFRNAFSTYFFNDDFFFLKISRIDNFNQFINFFSPIKNYFYRPFSTELFYWIIHVFKEDAVFGHVVVFFVYFLGLLYLFKVLNFIFKDNQLTFLSIGLYAINSIHVFQLYFLGTFQEVASFSFLIISFYYFLKQNRSVSITFFVLACMSKEIAILFPIFLTAITLIDKKIKNDRKNLLIYYLISLIFAFIFKFGVTNVLTIDIYKIQLKPKLGLNNLMWYFLWSLGFPNFMPDYFISIFRKPIPEFAKVLASNQIRLYFVLLFSYLFSLILGIILFFFKKSKDIKRFLIIIFFSLFSFILFISPTLLIIHKWMVRLTIPLIFIVFIEALIIQQLIKIGKIYRLLGIIIIFLYIILNTVGISMHESSSTYILESTISRNASIFFKKNYNQIVKHKIIYFKDPTIKNFNPWGGSKKLKVTFSDQNFIDHFFPGKNLQAVYEFENKKIPSGSFVIDSFTILNGSQATQ